MAVPLDALSPKPEAAAPAATTGSGTGRRPSKIANLLPRPPMKRLPTQKWGGSHTDDRASSEQNKLDHRERLQRARRQLPHFHTLKRSDTLNLEKARGRRLNENNLILDQQSGQAASDNPCVKLAWSEKAPEGAATTSVRSSGGGEPAVSVVRPLVYKLVKLPESAPTWRHAHARDQGQLILLARDFSHTKTFDLDQPVLNAPDGNAIRADDHQDVFADDAVAGASKSTTMRHVLLHGRGSLGETPLHLLFLLYKGADARTGEPDTSCVHRQAINQLLKLPPRGEAFDEPVHPETQLSRNDIEQMVNARYEGPIYHGETPLHFAIVKNDLQMVELLLQCGASATKAHANGLFFYERIECFFGGSPIGFAACLGHEAVLKKLFDKGADIDAIDPGPVLLSLSLTDEVVCSATGRIEEKRKAKQTQGQKTREVRKRGALIGRLPRSLPLSSEAHLGRDFCTVGNSVLHAVVMQDRVEMYRRLLQLGANPNVRNKWGQTPLSMAAQQGSYEMFRATLDAVSLEVWKFGNVRCVKYPLAEIDPLLRDDVSKSLNHPDVQKHGERLLGNDGHDSVLELLVRYERLELLTSPQVRRLLLDKYEICTKYVMWVELFQMVVNLALVMAALLYSMEERYEVVPSHHAANANATAEELNRTVSAYATPGEWWFNRTAEEARNATALLEFMDARFTYGCDGDAPDSWGSFWEAVGDEMGRGRVVARIRENDSTGLRAFATVELFVLLSIGGVVGTHAYHWLVRCRTVTKVRPAKRNPLGKLKKLGGKDGSVGAVLLSWMTAMQMYVWWRSVWLWHKATPWRVTTLLYFSTFRSSSPPRRSTPCCARRSPRPLRAASARPRSTSPRACCCSASRACSAACGCAS